MRRYDMLVFSALSFLLMFFLWGSVVQASDQEKVVWHVSHFPPANILNGAYKGEGFADKTRRYFQKRIADFGHEDEVFGFKESFAAAAERKFFCRADLLKTSDREKVMVFSKPIYFLSSRRLVVKREAFGKLTAFLSKKGELDFERFISSDGVRLSYVPGRAYFIEEPESFTRYKQKNQTLAFKMSKHSFDAFHAGVADYVIAYPFEYAYYARTTGNDKPYRSVRIAGFKPFATGYIACSKSALGDKVIARVNAIVDEQKGAFPWLEYYRDWVADDEWDRVERYVVRTTGG